MNSRQRDVKRHNAIQHNELHRQYNKNNSEEAESRSKVHEAERQIRSKARAVVAHHKALRDKKRVKRQTARRAKNIPDPNPGRDKMMGLTKIK